MSNSDPFATPEAPTPNAGFAPYGSGAYETMPSFTAVPPVPAPVRRGGFVLPIIGLLCVLIALGGVIVSVRPVVIIIAIAFAVAGVICGHIALARPAGSRGRGLAIATLVLGYLALVVGILHLAGIFLLERAIRRRIGPRL